MQDGSKLDENEKSLRFDVFVKVLYLQCFVFKQDEKRETKITIIRFAPMAMDVLL